MPESSAGQGKPSPETLWVVPQIPVEQFRTVLSVSSLYPVAGYRQGLVSHPTLEIGWERAFCNLEAQWADAGSDPHWGRSERPEVDRPGWWSLMAPAPLQGCLPAQAPPQDVDIPIPVVGARWLACFFNEPFPSKPFPQTLIGFVTNQMSVDEEDPNLYSLPAR